MAVASNETHCRSVKAAQYTATITGTVTHAPKRIQTITGRIMAAVTVLVESERRSPYPMQVIGFDLLALELMIHQRGGAVNSDRRGGLSQRLSDHGKATALILAQKRHDFDFWDYIWDYKNEQSLMNNRKNIYIRIKFKLSHADQI